jgi:hypothetical protein
MIAFPAGRTRCTEPLALVLLVIQGLAAGTVALAHASEHVSAAAHGEAHHDASCLVLHDELRCALWQYAGSRAPARTVRPVLGTRAPLRHVVAMRGVAPASRRAELTSPPRAPPRGQVRPVARRGGCAAQAGCGQPRGGTGCQLGGHLQLTAG